MDTQTIKVSLQSIEIPAVNLYVHLISILIVLFLTKKIFGKQIFQILFFIREKVVDLRNRQTHEDWTASCRKRKDWPQKQDVLNLDLKGRYLKSLTFSVSLKGNPEYWRAGFVLGNEKIKVNEIVDTKNGITIHTGSGYAKQNKILPVWKYYNEFVRNNPDSSSVKSDNWGMRTFNLSINKNNFMQVKLQDEVIFAQRIDSSFRRKVYLKAWADDYPDCKIKFRNIRYTVWS
jgi:hypothetical protein